MKSNLNDPKRRRRDPADEDRLERIGDILARGVARLLEREQAEKAPKERAITTVEVTPGEAGLMILLERHGSMSPVQIRRHLERSRATVSRMTRSLLKQGMVRRDGQTTATFYSLTAQGKQSLSMRFTNDTRVMHDGDETGDCISLFNGG